MAQREKGGGTTGNEYCWFMQNTATSSFVLINWKETLNLSISTFFFFNFLFHISPSVIQKLDWKKKKKKLATELIKISAEILHSKNGKIKYHNTTKTFQAFHFRENLGKKNWTDIYILIK